MDDINLADIITELHYVADLLTVAHKITRMPNCNDCALANCQYRPAWGMSVRYNCPLYVKEDEKK